MKDNPTLSILITTMNEWIERVKKELLPQLEEVDEVIISHQITRSDILPEIKRLWDNVKYYTLHSRWVSINRNNTLQYATSTICLICDDDVSYVQWFDQVIINNFKDNEQYDLLSFEFVDPNQEKLKKYPPEWCHKMTSVLNLWWLEIAFKRESILSQWILFDENFGFSKYISWEDSIFLTDCIKSGMKCAHVKENIWVHPAERNRDMWSKSSIKDKWAVFYRIFHWYARLIVPYFASIKYSQYKSKVWFIGFIILMYWWIIDFLKSKQSWFCHPN